MLQEKHKSFNKTALFERKYYDFCHVCGHKRKKLFKLNTLYVKVQYIHKILFYTIVLQPKGNIFT